MFLCECGPNIKEHLDLDRLASACAKMAGVAWVGRHALLCSEGGRKWAAEEIRSRGFDRVVVGACSPREHEATFQSVCELGGINPFLLRMSNIRELCAWVTADPDAAVRKAAALLSASVRRVALHQPLEIARIPCNPDVLVIGAGVAGIEATLHLAGKGRRVYLVERSPMVGGRTVRYEQVYPALECATCMLEGKLDDLLHRDSAKVWTLSEVEEVKGSFGNFRVRVRRKARSVDPALCMGCGACIPACPVEVPNEYDEGLGKRKAIFTPFAGALPNVPSIDRRSCLRFQGGSCAACRDACPFGAVVYEQEDEVVEIPVGAVVAATGFSPVGAAEAFPSVAGHPGVYDGAAFERLHSSTGPTGGALQRRDGRVPASAAVIHCAGSRSEKGRDYCSRVCCGAALKHALALAAKRPGAPVFEVVSDWCLGGEGLERLRREAEAGGRIEFVRAAGPSSVGVESGGDRIVVSCRTAAGTDRRLEVDLVVLETAMAPPAGLPELAARFPLALGESGFLQVSHAKVDPVSTAVRGIQVAGCARGPSDIPEAVAQGAAAAGKILSMLVPGETIALEPRASRIDDRLCAGCRTCVSVCPFGAIRFDPGRGVCAVEEALCLGCGSCAASCPSGAADLKDCTLGEVLAEIEGLASAEL